MATASLPHVSTLVARLRFWCIHRTYVLARVSTAPGHAGMTRKLSCICLHCSITFYLHPSEIRKGKELLLQAMLGP